MKYWRGYMIAVVFGIFTYLLQDFAQSHAVLIDMVYPYVTRLIQDILTPWSSSVDFLVWQVGAVLLALALVVSLVLMILLRWNLFQWAGWVAAVASILFFLHTGLYGLNSYAGSVADDIRMEQREYTISELAEATTYYRDKANVLAEVVSRTGGALDYPSFEDMAEMAGDGFQALVYDYSYPIFAGNTTPVKELGWADMYTSMGITGYTMSLTGEAAVNPQIPVVSIPFTMCHEMAHRMSIAVEKDANFAGFLACHANPSAEFQYSAYFMAYRYCYNALASVGTSAGTAAAQEIASGVSSLLKQDIDAYNSFYAQNQKKQATKVANTINDAYIKGNGDSDGITSYGNVTDLLVSWWYQEEVLPTKIVEENPFDPYDKTQVDINSILGIESAEETVPEETVPETTEG